MTMTPPPQLAQEAPEAPPQLVRGARPTDDRRIFDPNVRRNLFDAFGAAAVLAGAVQAVLAVQAGAPAPAAPATPARDGR